MRARHDGKPLASERWFVQAIGQIVKTPLSAARRKRRAAK